jgi:hypothetical protein
MTVSAAQRRHLDSSRLNPISDEELGLVAATMGEPRLVVAEMLGRSTQMVGVMRRMVKNGDSRKGTNRFGTKPWSEDEDEAIRALGEQRVSGTSLLEMFPGRTLAAITFRRSKLGRPVRLGVGGRAVIAKTCTACGLLLAGEWFHKNMGSCRRCAVDHARIYTDAEKRDARALARRRAYQAVTLPLATKWGEEYTEDDMRILSDPHLSDVEKALRLRRTFVATSTARRKRGLPSSATRLDNLDLGEWAIQIRADQDRIEASR